MHLIRIQDLNRQNLEDILSLAREMNTGDIPQLYRNHIMASLFFEPSTRTRLSFESAMMRLGGRVIGITSFETSSMAKGEDLADTARILSGYADLLVIRHPWDGAVQLVADYTAVPVINAGDGCHQHPTQTLLDLYTILQHKATIDGLNIGILGDLRFDRAAHSLILGLTQFDVSVHGITTADFRFPQYIMDALEADACRCSFHTHPQLDEVIVELDVLYIAYGQEGILLDEVDTQSLEELREMYRVGSDLMKLAKRDLLLLHPLPRKSELERMLDEDIRAQYFEQAKNGIPVRMGLLAYLSQQTGESTNLVSPTFTQRHQICPNSRCVTNHEREIQAVFEQHGTHWYCRFCESIS